MEPLVNQIYVHSKTENQWYQLRTSRFENQRELLTKKFFWTNSIFAKTAALVGSLSGVGMIIGPVIKLSLNKAESSDTNTGIQILPIVGTGVAFISAVWAIYQRCYCNRLNACRSTLNKNLDEFFKTYKGKASFDQFFEMVVSPSENSEFKFEIDRAGEIDPFENEEGCCLVQLNQN
jgi:hypothetical protein